MAFLDPFSKKLRTQSKPVKIKIIVDHREKNSLIPSELSNLGFQIEYKQLPVADYLVNNTAIERKTISDFKSSIVNKRIIRQLLELKQYPNHLLILEGFDKDPYSPPGIHENAFRGFLLNIILENQIPIIFTQNEQDTARYIYVLAKRKQNKELSLRPSKIYKTEKEQLQFILEGFPQIGPSTAKKLLKHFKTLKQISNASIEDLQKIIGKKSETLHKLLNKKY